MRTIAALCTLAALLVAACRPDLGDRDSLVSEERILAVRGEPPEAKLGEVVTYQVLVASPDPNAKDGPVAWAFCATPKTLNENNVVSTECLGEGVHPFAAPPAYEVTEPMPGDGCALFGPETPPGNFRPRDPDQTGGYFQPVRVRTKSATAFGLERLVCNLANAPVDIAQEFKSRYTTNKNPHLAVLVATVNGAPRTLAQLPAGERVDFQASWAPEDPEAYVAFDIATQSVAARRESLRVSWFATAGAFDADRTGRGETEPETSTVNGWRAPDESAKVILWMVLRDSRGGVDFARYELGVVR